MGNPAILNQDERVPADHPPPPPHDMRWDVYVMRKEGRRLARGDIQLQRGTLVINSHFGAPSARLTGTHNIDLGILYDVQIRQLKANGAILLRGMQWVTHSKVGVQEYPQSWWCVPRGYEPPEQR
jgi:hypothetical protein